MGGSVNKQNSSSQGSGWNAGNTGGVNGGINGTYGVNQSGNFGSNQSSGGSSSSGSSVGSSTQDVWAGQSPHLVNVYNAAGNAFNEGMNEVNAMKGGVQDAMGGALAAGSQGYGNQMGGGFAAGLQDSIGENAYTDRMKQMIAADTQKLKQQNLGSLDARAAAAGMSGSSGYRDQVGKMMDNADENALNAMTQVGYDSVNQGIQNQMNLAGMMDRNQQAGLGNMGAMQQAAMAMFNPSLLGQQMAGQYGQTIGGPTVLGNSFNASNNTANSFNQSNGFNSGFSNGFNTGFGVNGGFNFGNNYGGNVNNSSSSGRGYGLDLG